MKALHFLHGRTLLVLIISQVAVFVCIRFQIRFDLDLLLFNLAIAFPLAFSIQSAFKRRDRALEYFSLFKGSSSALLNSFRLSEDLMQEKKQEVGIVLDQMANQLISQLETRDGSFQHLQKNIEKVISFIEINRGQISNRAIQRMVRYIREVTESSSYLISLIRHRTMLGLRFYSVAFIIIFPLVQAPIILYRMESAPVWSIYLLSAFTSLILVTLSNFQKMIEYPFDPKGVDNIQVEDFKLNS
jgi:hypothetical protein